MHIQKIHGVCRRPNEVALLFTRTRYREMVKNIRETKKQPPDATWQISMSVSCILSDVINGSAREMTRGVKSVHMLVGRLTTLMATCGTHLR